MPLLSAKNSKNMPELPEVHTTVEGLKKVIVGKTIKKSGQIFMLERNMETEKI